MKSVYTIALVMGWLVACAYVEAPAPQVFETESQLIVGCDKLGVLAETTDADHPITFIATRRMVKTIKKRAARLGATHIVWLHKTAHAATAEAYRCPPATP